MAAKLARQQGHIIDGVSAKVSSPDKLRPLVESSHRPEFAVKSFGEAK
jgi:hypothetical protein